MRPRLAWVAAFLAYLGVGLAASPPAALAGPDASTHPVSTHASVGLTHAASPSTRDSCSVPMYLTGLVVTWDGPELGGHFQRQPATWREIPFRSPLRARQDGQTRARPGPGVVFTYRATAPPEAR